jgi:hypothetical protein
MLSIWFEPLEENKVCVPWNGFKNFMLRVYKVLTFIIIGERKSVEALALRMLKNKAYLIKMFEMNNFTMFFFGNSNAH